MGKEFKDRFNSANTIENKSAVLESSNKLRNYTINDIERVFKSGDFLALNDPLKIRNLEMFGINNDVLDKILVAEVQRGGHKVYQFVNTSDTNGMKRGDILTLDPDREGKENQTEFDEEFTEYCIGLIEKGLPNITQVSTPEKIMETLGLKTFEDVIYRAGKKDSFSKQIEDRIRTLEDKKEFVEDLGADKSKTRDENDKTIEEEEEQEKNENEQGASEGEQGMTIEEAATELQIDVEVLREAVGGDCDRILGARRTGDVESLNNHLDGKGLSEAGSSDVILLKVAGPGIKPQGLVIDTNGKCLYSPENGDTGIITELVEDGSNGEDISDINQAIVDSDAKSKKIITVDSSGKEVINYATQGNERSIDAYEEKAQTITEFLHEEIDAIINSKGEKSYSERLAEVSDKLYLAKGQLIDLQKAYGVTEELAINQMEKDAAYHAEKAEVEGIKEDISDGIGAVLDVGAGAVSAVASAIMKRPLGSDPREKDHSGEHELGGKYF